MNKEVQIGYLSIFESHMGWCDSNGIFVYPKRDYNFLDVCKILAKKGWKPSVQAPYGTYIIFERLPK